jgi:hypothetical protein
MIELESGVVSAGNLLPGMTSVNCDLTGLSHNFSLLFFTLNEIWLKNNCKKNWFMKISYEFGIYKKAYSLLSVNFEDRREAILFKLSPQFELFLKRTAVNKLQYINN